MDPYERARLEYEGMQQAKPAILRLTESFARLQEFARESAHHGRDKLIGGATRKQPALPGFVREEPRLSRKTKIGVSLVTFSVALAGGLLLRRRKKRK